MRILGLKYSECREISKISGDPEFKFFSAAGQADVLAGITFYGLLTEFCKLIIAVEIKQSGIFSSGFEIEHTVIFCLMIDQISLIWL